MITHLGGVGGVERFEVAHVAEKDVDVHDVGEIRSDGLQHRLEAVEDLTGLRSDVRPREPARRRIDAGGTAETPTSSAGSARSVASASTGF